MNSVGELRKYGFKEVGYWKKTKNNKERIDFELKDNEYQNKRVIYAFVVDEQIKYIGICDSYNTTLKNRMRRYRKPTGGSTNKRIAEKINNCLKNGKDVKIFALDIEQSLAVRYRDLEIDLVRGLEYPLIKRFNPDWNKSEIDKNS